MRYEEFIKRHLDISMVSGKEFYGRCPFHQDTTPSFAINGETGLWICHACGVKGNIHHLANQLGIGVHVTASGIKSRAASLKESMDDPVVEVMRPLPDAWLAQFRHRHIYWDHRGIGRATQKAFELGYDQQWNAVTIPIRDVNGALLGVVRRRLDDDGPRYIYPKGFKRAQNLFASWMMDDVVAAALVEGPIDALACWDAGIPALAMYGSHLSSYQIQLIKAIGLRSLAILTDRDEAGARAAEAIVTELEGVILKFPRNWPEGAKDPGDLANDQLNEVWAQTVPLWGLN